MGIFDTSLNSIYMNMMLGLGTGAFYAIMSLGLAIIFGLLGVINFAHGALFMLGGFLTWLLLEKLGLGYWWSLLLVPLMLMVLGMLIERFLLTWIKSLDHIYSLLLTLGLALVIEGLMHKYMLGNDLRITYSAPEAFRGAVDLGFMRLPKYRGWTIIASLGVCLATWFMIERTKLGALLRAGTENPTLLQSFGVNVPMMVTLTYGFGIALAGFASVVRIPIETFTPTMGTAYIVTVFAVVVIGGMGSILGAIITGVLMGLIEGLTKAFYPQASTIVIFVVMVIVLLIRPAGLFGREH